MTTNLFPGAKSRGVDIAALRFETVEAPNECQFEITGHVVDLHAVVLSGIVDGHGWRPFVENIIGFHIKFTASFFSELPFDTGIDFP